KLLQLSNAELAAYIEGEIERNPLLEADDGERDAEETPREADAPAENGAADGFDAPEQTDAVDFNAASETGGVTAGDDPIDADIDNVHHSDFGGGTAFDQSAARSGRADFDDDDRSLEDTLGEEGDLRSHLLAQAQIDIPDDVDRLIFLRLLDALDENGRLAIDLDALASELGCTRLRVDGVLSCAQRMDPTGVFARDLKECLALQLRERDRLDPCMAALLDHLDLLADREVDKLRKLCGVDQDDLMDMVAEIRALDPLPGQQWSGEPATVVAPDILMRTKPGGGWHIELNADTLPRVLVNTHYSTTVAKSVRDKTEREFVGECWQAANWLVKSLHQRANTILKVAGEIVRQQENFFIFGVEHLKPLVLR
ncbi:MAG: RNA polymerase sigma-54 factor, partial [Pseudomonadota bacterium]